MRGGEEQATCTNEEQGGINEDEEEQRIARIKDDRGGE